MRAEISSLRSEVRELSQAGSQADSFARRARHTPALRSPLLPRSKAAHRRVYLSPEAWAELSDDSTDEDTEFVDAPEAAYSF